MFKSITSQLSDDAIYQILEIIASEIDDIDNKAEERSLSLKYSGDIGFTSSVLK